MPYGWGKRSPHWNMNHEAYAACQRAGTGWIRGWFSNVGWFNIGAILNERGFNAAEIECILRSEWMLYVTESVSRAFGTYNSADFERVLGIMTKDPGTFRAAASDEMLDEIEEIERKQREDE